MGTRDHLAWLGTIAIQALLLLWIVIYRKRNLGLQQLLLLSLQLLKHLMWRLRLNRRLRTGPHRLTSHHHPLAQFVPGNKILGTRRSPLQRGRSAHEIGALTVVAATNATRDA